MSLLDFINNYRLAYLFLEFQSAAECKLQLIGHKTRIIYLPETIDHPSITF